MNIYFTHSRAEGFDFRNRLYLPIRQSYLNSQHNFVFPFEKGNMLFDSRFLMSSGGLDLVLAEVSYESTREGIELGWADNFDIPIYLLSQKGKTPSESIRRVSDSLFFYSSESQLIEGVEESINSCLGL
ncbi:hypothetical protein J4407_00875 [Candidatus Pacearchaeota archaeon]|nr:hypothetical protein [Candidatus Pacearchaeota archaeon]